VKAISVAQQAIFFDPTLPETRNRLATLMLQTKQYSSVLPLLSGQASNQENLGEAQHSLNLRAVAETITPLKDSSSFKGVHSAQKGIRMRPSDPEGWIALSLVRSQAHS
jgi:superkiller protein 3